MAYWALEALDGSKTALSSLDRVEGTDPPAYKLGRRPHEESQAAAATFRKCVAFSFRPVSFAIDMPFSSAYISTSPTF